MMQTSLFVCICSNMFTSVCMYVCVLVLQLWGGSGSWRQLEEHIPARTYTVTSLKPHTQYRAVVRYVLVVKVTDSYILKDKSTMYLPMY